MVKTSNAKVVLITGAARRIGAALALDFAAHGWQVGLHYHRSEHQARQLATRIEADTGAKTLCVQADLRNEAAVQELPSQVRDGLGSIDCLINNASLFIDDGVGPSKRGIWDDHMAVNLRAAFLLSRHFAQVASRGNVINIIDQRVLNLTPFFTSYTLSKAGLWTLTRTLAMALAPDIRVNALSPGPIFPSIHQSEKQFIRQYRALPLQRPGTTEEICQAAHFFTQSPSVTGQMIAIDSGQHLGWRHQGEDG